ncbi:MAG: multidrug efflux system membrane fusion protein [Candidatus Azotimanducaceae bacterium]|jgi:multidrug efflux system membrane fusion protein
MRSTYITAVIIGFVVLLWLGSGQLREKPPAPPVSVAEQNRIAALRAEEKPALAVRVATIYGSEQSRLLTVRGETRSKRTVSVKSQIHGTLKARLVERGDRVSAGDVLCQISEEDRVVAVTESEGAHSQAKIEYEGSQRLALQGLQSQTLIAQSKARLAKAEADLKRSQLDLGRLQIRAPFDGLIEDVGLELGDFVTSGSSCVTLVALDPMLLVGRISERDINKLKDEQIGRAELSSGEVVEGRISFIGKVADTATRTYAIELEIDNSDFAIESGLTAQIVIPVQHVMAHKISPALLSLDDEGNIGVRTITSDQQVEFYLVEIIRDAEDGIWVTGLPEVSTIITVGHELVVAGEIVKPTFETLDVKSS